MLSYLDYNYLTNNGSNPLPDSFYEALSWSGYVNYFKEVQMDLFNNEVGRRKKDWLTNGYSSLTESILDAINNDKLRFLSHLLGGSISGRATNLLQLIPTN